MKELKAKIKGHSNYSGDFEHEAKFTLLEPEANEVYYGTGCYMQVAFAGNKNLVDVRYAGTKNLAKLAKQWIEGYFGSNLREVTYDI